MTLRVGIGHDVHRLVVGRPLIVGGVTIPFEQGLLGHSDADVLVHAVCDALVGAAGLGDIGRHFPDSDPAYAGVSSLVLLRRCLAMLVAGGWSILNIDSTIFAQAPRMAPFREAMCRTLAEAMALNPSCVNVKATTSEGLGAFGRGEGIGATAIALIAGASD